MPAYSGHDGPALARAGQCLCRRQSARRRRVRARMAPDRPAAPTSSATWDDYHRRRRGSDPAADHLAAPAGRGRRQPGRAAGRHRDHPAAGTVQRGDHPGAAVRHAALPSDRRGRVVDRRIWRSAHARAARLDRRLFALSEAAAGRDLSDALHPDLDRRRPRHPAHGRKAAARLRARRALSLLREYRRRPRRGGEPPGDGAKAGARICLRDAAGWWTEPILPGTGRGTMRSMVEGASAGCRSPLHQRFALAPSPPRGGDQPSILRCSPRKDPRSPTPIVARGLSASELVTG